jgi:hypothetical protein
MCDASDKTLAYNLLANAAHLGSEALKWDRKRDEGWAMPILRATACAAFLAHRNQSLTGAQVSALAAADRQYRFLWLR